MRPGSRHDSRDAILACAKGAYGESEFLWVAPEDSHYRVLVAPIAAYGLSVDTIVEAETSEGGLEIGRVVHRSSHGTVRCSVPKGQEGHAVFHASIQPRARVARLRMGQPTFCGPRFIALDIPDAERQLEVRTVLDDLERQGVIEQWELGDPRLEPLDVTPEESLSLAHRRITHPPMVSDDSADTGDSHGVTRDDV